MNDAAAWERVYLAPRPSQPRRGRLNVRRVLIGALFTFVGLVSLMIPALPFICIGALIFGPIELIIGLMGNERPRPGYAPATRFDATGEMARTTQQCGACGTAVDARAKFCPNCGAPFA